MSRTRTDCEGFHRRYVLRVGVAGLLGMSLPDALRAEALNAPDPRVKKPATGVIQIWLSGGPATIDMWDLKPDAPEGIRGEFRPIATTAPGVSICEHMPGLAKVMDLGSAASAISSKGLPLPMVLAALTAALELGGGLLIVIGWQTRPIALALALFTLVAAYFFHDFWNMAGAERADNMIHALKNLSIFAGFLMLAAVGAGRYSLDGPCIRHVPGGTP